jgi:DNA replication protein DnaC
MARKNEPRDPLEVLRTLLLELNLTTVAKRLAELLTQAENSHPGYSDFLREVLEAEQTVRWARKIVRKTRWSRLGAHVSLDRFNFAVRPQLSPQVLKEILTCRFVEERRNLIIVGRPSTGKTTVAKAVGHAACERGFSVYYGALGDILETLHASRADGTYRRAFRRIERPDLLILEDCGFDISVGREAANELFRMVCARYRERSTIVVTNLPFKKWGEFLPSPAQAVAIVERLIDQATILRFSGKPFREPRDIYGAPLDDESSQ